jgi:hypothetical protein
MRFGALRESTDHFDVLTLSDDAHERDLETGLLRHLREFFLEMGMGFALVGTQYHLEVGGEDFYLDVLFYHLRLRCYVVVELKIGEFKPEYAGKMNFYLAAVDDLLRDAQDQPSIGIILCRTRNRTITEYALRDMRAPPVSPPIASPTRCPKTCAAVRPPSRSWRRRFRRCQRMIPTHNDARPRHPP